MTNVFYVKGPIQTDVYWTRPDKERFNAWLSEFKKYIQERDIDIQVYLIGGFIDHPEDTWDIDIQLTHPKLFDFTLKQLKQLRDLMVHGMQIGHDRFKLLIDMQCILPRSKTDPRWHYSLGESTVIQKLLVFTEVYQQGKRIYKVDYERKITDDLFLVQSNYPSKKHTMKNIPFSKPIRLY